MKKYLFNSFILFIFIFPTYLSAQNQGKVCWHHYDTEQCRTRIITEITFLNAAKLGNTIGKRSLLISSNYGVLFSINEKVAIGGHFFLGLYKKIPQNRSRDDWHLHTGFRPHIRLYLPKNFHFDMASGFMFSDTGSGDRVGGVTIVKDKFTGISTELSIGWKDWIGISTRFDSQFLSDNPSKHYWSIGVKIGKSPAIGTALGSFFGILLSELSELQ